MLVNESLAVRVVVGAWPDQLPEDEPLALPPYRNFRLLRRTHQRGRGQLSTRLTTMGDADQQAIRRPHPDVLQILDPRPLLDDAASIGARFATGGVLATETLAAGLAPMRLRDRAWSRPAWIVWTVDANRVSAVLFPPSSASSPACQDKPATP